MPPPPRKRQAETADDEETKSSAKKFAWQWQKKDDLIFGECGAKASKNIVSFDMDSTLIDTKSGKSIAQNPKDWKLWNAKVPAKVKEWADKGYTPVIFTNQKGVAKGHISEKDIKNKIEEVVEALGVPFKVCIATDDSFHRKPAYGMWYHYVKDMNEGIPVDLKNSVYVGDAAGRVKGKKKDHSDSDYKFALNVELPFMTPEEFFLDDKSDKPGQITWHPKDVFKKGGPLFKDGETSFKPIEKEVLILVGSPGAGKSTFTAEHLKDYERVNQDTLKTKEKCHKAVEAAMKAGKKVAVDNTNRTVADRAPYLKLAKDNGYTARCIFFNYPKDVVFHLNELRSVNGFREHHSKVVADVQVHSWYKQLETPTTSEGFTAIKEVVPHAGPFKSAEDERMFFSYVC